MRTPVNPIVGLIIIHLLFPSFYILNTFSIFVAEINAEQMMNIIPIDMILFLPNTPQKGEL